jgi:pimeloyl-ACP methyl ester carboxylesterase
MCSDTADAPHTALPAPPDGQQRLPDQVQVAERTFRFDGFAYHCRVVHQDAPTTPPMVLLGGSSQNRHAWLRHQKWLAEPCTLVTVDLPGYGAADFLPARYGIDFLAAAVRHMLIELGIPRINLVGACFGAAIALRFAQHYPGQVARLALGGMTLSVPEEYAAAVPRWTGMLERGELAQAATELAQRFMSPPGTGPVRKREVVSRLLYQQFMAQSADDIKKVLEHNLRLLRHEWYRPEPLPAVPHLVFTGEYDTLCTPAMGREVAAALPAAVFTTVKEADHLVSVERMADFSDLLVRFCTGCLLTGLPYCNPVETPDGASARSGIPAPSTAPSGRTRQQTPA